MCEIKYTKLFIYNNESKCPLLLSTTKYNDFCLFIHRLQAQQNVAQHPQNETQT